jgi:hypothetical protein
MTVGADPDKLLSVQTGLPEVPVFRTFPETMQFSHRNGASEWMPAVVDAVPALFPATVQCTSFSEVPAPEKMAPPLGYGITL